MGPAILAFLILVIVATLGVYIVKSGNMYKPEGFDAASRQAALTCETNYVDCMKNRTITDKSTCQTTYRSCIASITNPSASNVSPDATDPKFRASSAAAAKINETLPTGTYDTAGNPTGTTGQVILGNPSETQFTTSYGQLASTARAGLTASPEFAKFLEQVTSNLPATSLEPSAGQLDLAQGAGVLPQTTITTTSGSINVPALGGTKDRPVYLTGDQVLALYAPAVQKIKPHQRPSNQLPSMEPQVEEDDDTEYASIQKDRPAVASLRQMIRDDVAQIVREEVDGSRIGNPYEVKYDYV
jgi:hypothetical protein